jgi:hypothetical protein
VVVGEVAAQQGEAAVLGDRFAFVEAHLWELENWDVAVRHGPGEEAAGALLLVNGGGGVPGVDIGLGESAGVAGQRGGPGEEVFGLDESLLGVFAGAGPQRCGGGFGAHLWQLVPEAELAQQPLVRVAGQGGQAAVHPAFVAGELPVGGRQGAAADQQVAQVDGGLPGAGSEGLVGEGEAAGDEVAEQAADMGLVEPAGGRRWVGCGGEGAGERPQGRNGGAVAEDGGDGLGPGAGVAEAAGAQVAFVVAAQAGEVAADAGAVAADGHLVTGAAAGQWPGDAAAGQAPRYRGQWSGRAA